MCMSRNSLLSTYKPIPFISSSGEGELILHRRNAGEIIENLAGSGEYHWMAGNFIKYGGHTLAPNWPTFLQFAERYIH